MDICAHVCSRDHHGSGSCVLDLHDMELDIVNEGRSAAKALAAVLRRQLRLRGRYHDPCAHCKKLFPRTHPGPHRKWCEECLGPDRDADARLRMFDLSYPEWDMMKKLCFNRCEICGKEPWGKIKDNFVKKELTIDHDHETGLIRGLLCWQCNLDLEGYLRIKDRAPRYLETADMRGDPRGNSR